MLMHYLNLVIRFARAISYSFEGVTSAELDAHVRKVFAVERDISIHTLANKPEVETWPSIALAWWNKARASPVKIAEEYERIIRRRTDECS